MDIYYLVILSLATTLALIYMVYSINVRVMNQESAVRNLKNTKAPVKESEGLGSVQVKVINDLINTDNRFSVPTRATEGSAAIDLRACITEPLLIPAGESVTVGTGIAIWVKDPNYAGIVLPRSGLGSNSGIVLGNLVGLIDSDYQGELLINVWNRGWEDFTLEPATRFAQYMVVPVVTPKFELVEEFDVGTFRGQLGFGHSGTA